MNKEEKSKDYAELKVKQYDKNNTIDNYGMNRAMQQCYFDGFDIQDAFEVGWHEALKSQWIKVEEKLPKIDKKVLVLVEYLGMIQIHTFKYFGETNWYFGESKVIAWLPIPSFDKILEDNKEVLKRLKDK